MGSTVRSEKMSLFQLILHNEVSYECISELGELSLVQFRDINTNISTSQKKFVSEVRRCGDMEHKLRYLLKELDKSGISKLPAAENLDAPHTLELVDLEMKITNIEHELREFNKTLEVFKRNLLNLKELTHVLNETKNFLDEKDISYKSMRVLVNDHSSAKMDVQLSFVTGVINRERYPGFERMLWRVFHGSVFLRQTEIKAPLEDPSTQDFMYKSVIMVLFQEQLRAVVTKICDGFGATLYICPDSSNKCREMTMNVLSRVQDIHLVLEKTQDQRTTLMLVIAKYIKTWSFKMYKSKAIYHTLNLFNLDVTQKCLIGECWVPVDDIKHVQTALERGMKCSDSPMPPIMNQIETYYEPPTFVRTNKFTSGFQYLIDAYGVANYQEISPMPYTIITFPFLFAVMFGDLGHGLIIFLFAAWMILKEKWLVFKTEQNDVWNILFGGRYVILLMGIFSMYTGLIYNDVFSKSMNIFGSHWNMCLPIQDVMKDKHNSLDLKLCYSSSPYPIGVDPVWQLSENKISFLNAYKMKISIIIGVAHMLFGLSLTVFNYIHFKKTVNIIVQFLPELIFLVALFFYLVFLIFIKWIKYGANNDVETGPGCAPSILITFINMMLFSPGIAKEPCSPWMYEGQLYIQYFLVTSAVLCVPWLFIAKPYVTLRQHTKSENLFKIENKSAIQTSQNTNQVDKTEILIQQGIHTIEFVLGSVSHTASYLRLWALSLAHAQLSEVLWKMVMKPGLMYHSQFGAFIIFLVFPFWVMLTISILVVMEGLSAFLHTLRLHWVEFQSKFYVGAGHPFLPFSFNRILDKAFFHVENEKTF